MELDGNTSKAAQNKQEDQSQELGRQLQALKIDYELQLSSKHDTLLQRERSLN